MKFIIPAGLLCLLCARLPAQAPADPQTPAPQAPAPQTPAPQTPAETTRSQRQTNAKPDNTAPDDIDNVFLSLKGFYWLTSGHFNLISGKAATSPGNSTLPTLGSANNHTYGGMVTFPGGKYNRLEVSFFQAKGSGSSTAPTNLTFYGQNFPAGEFLTSNFRIRTAKVTWNYLTWPDPPEAARFRLKTLWEFHWSSVQTVIDAPYDFSIASPAVGTRSIYYPTFGVGAEYVVAKHFYLDSRASAFAWPHHAVVWDAEANAVLRIKFLEVFGGYKASHLKTSPQNEEYIVGTLQGGYGGLRLVFR